MGLRMRSGVTSSILSPYRKAAIIQTPTNEAYRVVRKETECEDSDAESTDFTDLNKATIAQEADDASHASYVNVNPTQLCYQDDDTRLGNVYIESGTEVTNPTYMNINATAKDDDTHLSNVYIESSTEVTDPTDNKVTATQESDDSSLASYVNVNRTQLLCASNSEVDEVHLSNVYIESGPESTDPTYMNINATATQGTATTTHASYVNVHMGQFSQTKN